MSREEELVTLLKALAYLFPQLPNGHNNPTCCTMWRLNKVPTQALGGALSAHAAALWLEQAVWLTALTKGQTCPGPMNSQKQTPCPLLALITHSQLGKIK